MSVESLQEMIVVSHHEEWRTIPDWCAFCFGVGEVLSQQSREGLRRTVIISVPIRDYAAIFCAAGAVCGRTIRLLRDETELSFDDVSSFPLGTPIECHYKGRWVPAEFGGISDDGRIRARFQSENSFLVGRQQILRIRRSRRKHFKVPGKNALRTSASMNGIFHYLIQTVTSHSLPTTPEPGLSCVIAGRITALRTEILDSKIGVFNGRDVVAEGHLQEILQIDKFVNSSKIEPRSQILPLRPRGIPDQAPLAILDGAHAYLLNVALFSDFDLCVVLDRTDPAYEEASHAVQDEYLRRVEVTEQTNIPTARSGIGVCNYWRESKS